MKNAFTPFNPNAFWRELLNKFQDPMALAILASAGTHLLLFVSMPFWTRDANSEVDSKRMVNLIELSAAEQARLPQSVSQVPATQALPNLPNGLPSLGNVPISPLQPLQPINPPLSAPSLLDPKLFSEPVSPAPAPLPFSFLPPLPFSRPPAPLRPSSRPPVVPSSAPSPTAPPSTPPSPTASPSPTPSASPSPEASPTPNAEERKQQLIAKLMQEHEDIRGKTTYSDKNISKTAAEAETQKVLTEALESQGLTLADLASSYHRTVYQSVALQLGESPFSFEKAQPATVMVLLDPVGKVLMPPTVVQSTGYPYLNEQAQKYVETQVKQLKSTDRYEVHEFTIVFRTKQAEG